MKTKVRQISRLLASAYSKSNEEKAWGLYLAQYPNMDEKTFIPFEEFYKPNRVNETVETKSAEQILKEIREMMNSHSVGGEK